MVIFKTMLKHLAANERPCSKPSLVTICESVDTILVRFAVQTRNPNVQNHVNVIL